MLQIDATGGDELVFRRSASRRAVRPCAFVDEYALRPVRCQVIGPYAAEFDERRKSVSEHVASMLLTLRAGVP
jgi:hypothetical protein